jgi:hypothetical protein
VLAAGSDALDLLRAGAVATWVARDADLALTADAPALIEAIRAVEPDATWAR